MHFCDSLHTFVLICGEPGLPGLDGIPGPPGVSLTEAVGVLIVIWCIQFFLYEYITFLIRSSGSPFSYLRCHASTDTSSLVGRSCYSRTAQRKGTLCLNM